MPKRLFLKKKLNNRKMKSALLEQISKTISPATSSNMYYGCTPTFKPKFNYRITPMVFLVVKFWSLRAFIMLYQHRVLSATPLHSLNYTLTM